MLSLILVLFCFFSGVEKANGISNIKPLTIPDNVSKQLQQQLPQLQKAAYSAGTSTTATSIFNLAKTILGAGVLSLPYGVASFSDDVNALYPASIMLVIMGLLSAYSFSSIGKICEKYNVRTFSDAWAKSVDPNSAKFISFIITFKTFFACLAYSIIIGDSFSQIFSSFGLPDALTQRSNVIVGLSSLFIFPLCSLKKLDALKYTSILGLLGTLYCAAFVSLRYLDGSYIQGGKFFSQISPALQPSFNARAVTQGFNPMIFMLISMIATAYVAHYNSPKFWVELKDKSIENFNKIVSVSFGFSAFIYIVVMILGFLTFGGHSTGFILNNYASSDKLATLARVAIGTGILCGYPLTFTALRDGVYDLLKINSSQSQESYFYPSTIIILGLITSIALKLKNVGKVVSLSGALIGSMLIYIIPAIMNICDALKSKNNHDFIKYVKHVPNGANNNNVSNKTVVNRHKGAVNPMLLLDISMGLIGIIIAIIGVAVNLMGKSSH
eukprot:gene6856-9390_t